MSIKFFFLISSEKRFPERRKLWDREKCTCEMISSAELCSKHFTSGSFISLFLLEEVRRLFQRHFLVMTHRNTFLII